MLELDPDHEAQWLGNVLSRYAVTARKTQAEVLEKKGRDLGIQLFKGFRQQQWGGASATGRNRIAFDALKQRTAAGEGTRVRPSLMKRYKSLRRGLLIRSSEISQREGKNSASKDRLTNIRRRVRLWQQIVGEETRKRGQGIGVLAAGFLWYRRNAGTRFSISQGQRVATGNSKEFVKNKSGSPLGSVERGPDFIRIIGSFEAENNKRPQSLISARYGIASRAIRFVARDTEEYIRTRQARAFNAAFREITAS